MPEVPAVIFDVGNVLIRWDARLLYRQLLPDEAAIDAFFAEIDFHAWNLDFDRGRPWEDGVAARAATFPHHAELLRAFHDRWHETVPGEVEGSAAVLAELAAAGVPLYAITNFSAEKWEECRDRFPFLREFDDAIVSAQERLLKPDPAIFDRFFRRTGCRAGECVFVDDGQRNVAAARAAGMHAILFRCPEELARELRARGLPA